MTVSARTCVCLMEMGAVGKAIEEFHKEIEIECV